MQNKFRCHQKERYYIMYMHIYICMYVYYIYIYVCIYVYIYNHSIISVGNFQLQFLCRTILINFPEIGRFDLTTARVEMVEHLHCLCVEMVEHTMHTQFWIIDDYRWLHCIYLYIYIHTIFMIFMPFAIDVQSKHLPWLLDKQILHSWWPLYPRKMSP